MTDLIVNSTGTLSSSRPRGSISSGARLGPVRLVRRDRYEQPVQPRNVPATCSTVEATPDGGNTHQSGDVLVNDQLAYVASTTSSGGDLQDGEGKC